MPDEMPVWVCQGVRKGAIADTVRSRRLNSLDEVRLHSTASACCRLCSSVVLDILNATFEGEVAVASISHIHISQSGTPLVIAPDIA